MSNLQNDRMCKACVKKMVFLVLLLNLSGCCLNGYRAEPIGVPNEAISVAIQERANNFIYEGELSTEWWFLFQDEQLKKFIELAFERNPTLDQARASIASAKFRADRARASLFPHLSWGADVSRQKLSETGLIPFKLNKSPLPSSSNSFLPMPAGTNGIPVYFTQYETEFILTYEFDFWGKHRNAWLAVLGEMQARMADEIFVRLQLGIAVAQIYFQLQIDYKRYEIAKRRVENRQQYLQLIEKRILHNIENNLALNSSKANASSAQQLMLRLEGEIAVHTYRLRSLLAGHFEEEIENVSIQESQALRVPVPVDISMNLLAHRPDIIAQLWLIESAGREIDVAKAGFYPNFSLGALFGFQTIHFRELFKWPSSYYNINPAVSLPLFDGGQLSASLHQSEVNYDEAIYHYNQLILKAVEEVLEGMAILQTSERQRLEFHQQTLDQTAILNLVELRVEHHLDSGLSVLDSEQFMLNARDQELVALGNSLQAALALIKALGGGYTAIPNSCGISNE